MKIELEENEEIKLNMTSMIDIVFQLLVFFIMTFNPVVQEGDYNVNMPLNSDGPADVIDDPPTLIRIRLVAGEDGGIAGIEVDDDVSVKKFAGGTVRELFQQLNGYIESTITVGDNPEGGVETEVEFDIDYGLKYAFTVRAIEAVSGKSLPENKVKKLIEKIKFKDNSGGG